jgi:pteridine reductase
MSTKLRVALVTGSGKKRIGWHVAHELARHGYALVVHYRSSARDATEGVAHFQSLGVDAIAIQADLRREDEVRRMVGKTLDHYGRLDVLVACAAIWKAKRFEDVTADDVREHFETNTLGSFLCAQQAGLAMVRQPEGGAIVLVGDWAEVRPYLDHAAYFPSKGAIPALTRTLAVELGTRNPNVRVNAILPGPVLLPEDLPETERREAIEATLVKREGNPENVARAAWSLIENDFVTGVCLPVDGGRTVYAGGW